MKRDNTTGGLIALLRGEPALAGAVLQVAVIALVVYAKIPPELEMALGSLTAILTGVAVRQNVRPMRPRR